MYTVFAGALIAALVALVFCRKTGGGKDSYIFGSIVSGIVGGAVGLALACTVMLHLAPLVWVEVGHWKLASMRAVDETQGVFALGSGTISGTSSYRVMLRNGDNSMTPYSVPATLDTRLVEDPQLHGEGRLTIRQVAVDPNSPWNDWAWIKSSAPRLHYDLHVPEGSVRVNFSAQ